MLESIFKTTTTMYSVGMEEPRKYSRQELKAIRKALGLNIADASRAVGCNPRAWELWEQGQRNPSGAARILIAQLEKQLAATA